MKYLIVIEPTATGFSAYVPDLPGCISTGPSLESLEKNMKEAIELHIDGLERDGSVAYPGASPKDFEDATTKYIRVNARRLWLRLIRNLYLELITLVMMAFIAACGVYFGGSVVYGIISFALLAAFYCSYMLQFGHESFIEVGVLAIITSFLAAFMNTGHFIF